MNITVKKLEYFFSRPTINQKGFCKETEREGSYPVKYERLRAAMYAKRISNSLKRDLEPHLARYNFELICMDRECQSIEI